MQFQRLIMPVVLLSPLSFGLANAQAQVADESVTTSVVSTQVISTQPTEKDCDMEYGLKGWSAIYKTAKGQGVITCDNGETATVEIEVHGGGLTFGKSTIHDGKAEISGVRSINDIYGSYASAAAHAGVVKSGEVAVMTKGEVSIALKGEGDGVDVGVDFSKFTISKADAPQE